MKGAKLEATDRTYEWTKGSARHGETWGNGVNENPADQRKLWKDCGNWETKTRKDNKRQRETLRHLTIRPNLQQREKSWRVSEKRLET